MTIAIPSNVHTAPEVQAASQPKSAAATPKPAPAQGSSKANAPAATVNISSAAQTAFQESQETQAQTAKEASHGDRQAVGCPVLAGLVFARVDLVPIPPVKRLLVPPRAYSGKNMPTRQLLSRKRPPLQPASQKLPGPPWLRRLRQIDATKSLHNPTSRAPRNSPLALSSTAQNKRESPIRSRKRRT